MSGTDERRTTSAVAISICVALKITCEELARVLREEHAFTDKFVKFIVLRGTRTQADLIDQFNNGERRLTRTLLPMAEFGSPDGPLKQIPPVTRETLAEMIGTTRSRVSQKSRLHRLRRPYPCAQVAAQHGSPR